MPGNSNILNFPDQLQQLSNWCWAATAVNVSLFYNDPGDGLEITQCQVANEELGMYTCCQTPQGWDLQQLTGPGSRSSKAPPAALDPFVVSYNAQLHTCYRAEQGNVYDVWCDASGGWHLQQLTGVGGLSDGPPAAGPPFALQYDAQMHVLYRGVDDIIYDVWYDGSGNWHEQAINGGGNAVSGAPRANGDPVAVHYDAQMHVLYRDGNDLIQDVFYDGSGGWHTQTLNGPQGIITDATTAVENPAVIQYHAQMHVCYRDGGGLVQDILYDGSGGWHWQTINGPTGVGPNTPSCLGIPALIQFDNEMHVCYRDAKGVLVDVWYDGSGTWHTQQLAGSAGEDGLWIAILGPPANNDPFVLQFGPQMHVLYRDASGAVQDVWYDGSGNWQVQELTDGGGLTQGPKAAWDVSACTYSNQMHVCYRELTPAGPGNIWDTWYSGSTCNVYGYLDQALSITGNLEMSWPASVPFAMIKAEIDAGSPVGVRVAWNNGGAHFIAIKGYTEPQTGDSTIDIWDPQNGHSTQDFQSFPATYFSGGSWTHTYFTQG